jgi:uncharacterized membrane protein YdjX (TVP38/TMEM64 family)
MWRKVLLYALIASLLIAVVAVGFVWGAPLLALVRDPERLVALAQAWGRWAPLVTIGLHILQVILAPIPGQALDTVNGFLFGPWLGTLYSMIGLGSGSTLTMALARRYGRPLVERWVDQPTLARLDRFSKRQLMSLFLIFLLPFLPDDALCFVAGLTPTPLGRLVPLMILGRLPGVFFANWLGSRAAHLSLLGWAIWGGILLALAVLMWHFQDPIQEALLVLVDRATALWNRWWHSGSS